MDSRILSIIGSEGRMLLDGASGTYMQDHGMPPGVCPESYALDHPELLMELQRSYYTAGSDAVCTFTFGGTYTKLSHFGYGPDEAFDMNRQLARISCEVRDDQMDKDPGRKLLVAGDIGPTGRFLEPAGDMAFAEMRDVYARQAKALAEGGVDFFTVETMMDLLQTKAAVAGIRQVSDLPVIVSLTFDKGKSLSGNTPEACLVALCALGADAFGANCSTGPDEMKGIIESLAKLTGLPIIAKPNAGMPVVRDGKTVFPMEAEEFAVRTAKLFAAGATVIGGCCGTSPLHIEYLRKKLSEIKSAEIRISGPDVCDGEFISSYCSALRLTDEVSGLTVRPDSADDITDLVMDASDDGAGYVVLDLRTLEDKAGGDTGDIKEAFAMTALSAAVPLGVICRDVRLLEELASVYPGRLAFAGETTSEVTEIAGRYGIKVV